jgi:hypothetical protein
VRILPSEIVEGSDSTVEDFANGLRTLADLIENNAYIETGTVEWLQGWVTEMWNTMSGIAGESPEEVRLNDG